MSDTYFACVYKKTFAAPNDKMVLWRQICAVIKENHSGPKADLKAHVRVLSYTRKHTVPAHSELVCSHSLQPQPKVMK